LPGEEGGYPFLYLGRERRDRLVAPRAEDNNRKLRCPALKKVLLGKCSEMAYHARPEYGALAHPARPIEESEPRSHEVRSDDFPLRLSPEEEWSVGFVIGHQPLVGSFSHINFPVV